MPLKFLEEGCFSITRITGNKHQPKLASYNRWHEVAIKRSFHIQPFSHCIEAACATVAALALAIQREQVGNIQIGIRLWRGTG